jgi:circadian clock protein KaiC
MIVDGTVELSHLAREFAGMRYRLTVQKVRASDFQGGDHDFEIVRGGLVVYPRLALAELPSTRRPRKEPGPTFGSGVERLDRMLGGGMLPGSSCLVVGPSGSGKTSLATRFAFEAAEHGATVVFFLFEELRETMLQRSATLGMDLRPHIEAGRVEVRELGGTSTLPGELASMVRDRVNDGVDMVVVDSLSGYYQSLPDEHLLLAQIRDIVRYLSENGVVSILTLAQGSFPQVEHVIPLDVSESVDVMLSLQFIEAIGQLRKSVVVVKRRDGLHERGMRELLISERGIEIGGSLGRHEGRMTGQPMISLEPDQVLGDAGGEGDDARS